MIEEEAQLEEQVLEKIDDGASKIDNKSVQMSSALHILKRYVDVPRVNQRWKRRKRANRKRLINKLRRESAYERE